jgi:hypothetical protein
VVFNRLQLFTADDAPERDPASYILYGSASALGGSAGANIPISGLTKIAEGTVTLRDARKAGPTMIQFANSSAYTSYVVVFPTVRNPATSTLTQISEVQLAQGIDPPFAVAMEHARGGQLVGSTFSFGTIGNNNPGTNWLAGESPDHALDGNINTKFAIFRSGGGALISSPQAGPAVVSSLTFWTANDAPERDPVSYQIYGFATRVTQTSGTLDIGTVGPTPLAYGTLTLPDARNSGPVRVDFANSTAFASYLVVFPAVKNSPATSLTQLSEIQFGYVPLNGIPEFTLSLATVTVAEDSGSFTQSAFATGITPDTGDVGQSVSLAVTNDNNALFSTQPVISTDGTLTFTPKANAYGTATVTVIATDSTGLSSAPRSFKIEVTSVIDAPVLAAPTFSNVSAYSATMQGEILNADVADYDGKAIIYAPTAANSTLTYYGAGAVTIPLNDPSFSTTRSNLLASGTSYSVRSCAYGPAGMIYSEVSTFSTLPGAPVMLDNTAGLSTSVTGLNGNEISTTQSIGYRFATGSQAVNLSTVTLGITSSGASAIRLRLFEIGADSLPTGDPLRVHQEPARNFGNTGVYATLEF